MHRQRTVKLHDQYVRIIFSAVALCLAILWAIPGLRPADARPVWQAPKPALPGVFPPPHPIRQAMFVPRFAGYPIERFPDFPPHHARFIAYRPVRANTLPTVRPAVATVPIARASAISSPVNHSEHAGQLWLENAHAGLFGKTPTLPKFLVPGIRKAGRLVPPPDGFRFRLRRPGPAIELSQEQRVISDRITATIQTQMAVQQPCHVEPHTLTAQFRLPHDRLQHLCVLRL